MLSALGDVWPRLDRTYSRQLLLDEAATDDMLVMGSDL
jgi:hypothetical protein